MRPPRRQIGQEIVQQQKSNPSLIQKFQCLLALFSPCMDVRIRDSLGATTAVVGIGAMGLSRSCQRHRPTPQPCMWSRHAHRQICLSRRHKHKPADTQQVCNGKPRLLLAAWHLASVRCCPCFIFASPAVSTTSISEKHVLPRRATLWHHKTKILRSD